jgi:hypothetical protein
MSKLQISRSPDLQKLRDEGFDIEIRAGHLLVHDVPYVNRQREIRRGILVSTLNLAGEVTGLPETHVAMFVGEYPCDAAGAELDPIRHSGRQQIAADFPVDWSFSSKPVGGAGYSDYYEKMTAYVAILESQAQAIDPTAAARTYPVIRSEGDESVFHYLDTASSRAGINMASAKLELCKVAIVGLGGTGSYVLDLVAKTWVKEIHLFDGDILYSHNAFRAPGAASIDELTAKPKKVTYFRDLYSKLRTGIIDHPYAVDATNVQELQGVDFIFLCIDGGNDKSLIVERLEEFGTPFIDSGMGIELVDDSLVGIVRVTASLPGRRGRFRSRVSMVDPQPDDDYDTNIQIADLNALNAALAVLKWKKLYGFYKDQEHELHSTYTIDCNMLLSEDTNEA